MPEKRRPAIVGVAVLLATAVTLVFLLIPVPQPFNINGAAIYDLQVSCTGIYATAGTTVTFHWSASSSVYFFVLTCSPSHEIYEANGTSGSGSFVSTGGVYEFGASCPGSFTCVPANVVGTHTSPILVVTAGDWTLLPLAGVLIGWVVLAVLSIHYLRRHRQA